MSTAAEVGPISASGAGSRRISGFALVLVCAMPFLFVRSIAQVHDPDTFWHIRAGEYLWKSWTFAGPEPWSRFSSRPWTLHEWLPELALFAAFRLGSLPAVAWLSFAGCVSLFLVLYWACRQFARTTTTAAIVTVVAWIGASASIGPRPQMVTFVFLTVTTVAWLKTLDDGRPRWWLIPLTWLWACSHGMWFSGPLAGLAVAVGMFLDRRVTWVEWRRLLSVPLLSLLAAALTPVGPRLLLVPLSVADYTKYVTEWAAPQLREPFVAATLLLAVLVAASWSRSARRISWARIGVLILAMAWSLMYARTVALGACMLAPLAAGTLHDVVPGNSGAAPGRERLTVLLAGMCSLILAAVVVAQVAVRPGGVPSALDAQLSALPRGTVVYNSYELGGWLLWRHQQLAPVIDGRTEVFSVSYVDRYMKTLAAQPGWESSIRASGARVALLAEDSALGEAMKHRLGWRQTGRSAGFILLQQP